MSLYSTTKDKVMALHDLIVDIIKNDLDTDIRSLLKQNVNHYYDDYDHSGTYFTLSIFIKNMIKEGLDIPIISKEKLKDLITYYIKNVTGPYFSDNLMLCFINFRPKSINYNITKNTLLVYSYTAKSQDGTHKILTPIEMRVDNV